MKELYKEDLTNVQCDNIIHFLKVKKVIPDKI